MPEQRRTYHRGGKNGELPLELAHVQPQAPEIEKAVLGALMIDKDAYMEVCNLLCTESFYEPRNQMIYEAIVKLSAEENPVRPGDCDYFLSRLFCSLRKCYYICAVKQESISTCLDRKGQRAEPAFIMSCFEVSTVKISSNDH